MLAALALIVASATPSEVVVGADAPTALASTAAMTLATFCAVTSLAATWSFKKS